MSDAPGSDALRKAREDLQEAMSATWDHLREIWLAASCTETLTDIEMATRRLRKIAGV